MKRRYDGSALSWNDFDFCLIYWVYVAPDTSKVVVPAGRDEYPLNLKAAMVSCSCDYLLDIIWFHIIFFLIY